MLLVWFDVLNAGFFGGGLGLLRDNINVESNMDEEGRGGMEVCEIYFALVLMSNLRAEIFGERFRSLALALGSTRSSVKLVH